MTHPVPNMKLPKATIRKMQDIGAESIDCYRNEGVLNLRIETFTREAGWKCTEVLYAINMARDNLAWAAFNAKGKTIMTETRK